MCDVRKQYGFCDWGLPHCRKCEEHLNEDHQQYSRQNPICDRCLLSDIQEEVANQVEGFGGNYEKAAEFHNW